MRKGVEVVAKKYIAIFLAVIIIFSSFSPVMVYAATTEVKQEKVDASKNGEEGYITTTTINGATYKDYKQGTYPAMGVSSSYSQISINGGIFGYVGCGPTSTAIILSAYGIKGGIGTNSLPYQCGIIEGTYAYGTNSCYDIKKAFDKYNVPSTVYTYDKSSNGKNIIDVALKAGKPIVFNVTGYGGVYTSASSSRTLYCGIRI